MTSATSVIASGSSAGGKAVTRTAYTDCLHLLSYARRWGGRHTYEYESRDVDVAISFLLARVFVQSVQSLYFRRLFAFELSQLGGRYLLLVAQGNRAITRRTVIKPFSSDSK